MTKEVSFIRFRSTPIAGCAMPSTLVRSRGLVFLVIFVAVRVPLAHGQEMLRLGTPEVPHTPTVMRLTLEEARAQALANNKEINLARLNALEKHYETGATRTLYLPRIIGSIAYLRFDEDLGKVVTVPQRKLGPIAIGGNTVVASLVNQNTTISGVTVLQPITKLITIHAAVQIAQADENIAHAQLEKGSRDLASGITQVYYGLLGLQQLEHAIGLQLAFGKKLEAVQPNPLLRLQIIKGEQGLLEVKGKVAELTDQLAFLLNVPPCTSFDLVEPLPMPLPVTCAGEAVQLALSNNPQLQEAEHTIVKAHNALKIARADFLPDLNIMGGAYNQHATEIIQENFSFVGVVATYSFEWGKKIKVKRQRETQVDMAHQNLQVTMDKVAQEVRKAYCDYDQAQQSLRLAKESVAAYQAVAKAAQDPVASATAQANTAQAELTVIQEELNYRVAHAKLLGAMGQP